MLIDCIFFCKVSKSCLFLKLGCLVDLWEFFKYHIQYMCCRYFFICYGFFPLYIMMSFCKKIFWIFTKSNLFFFYGWCSLCPGNLCFLQYGKVLEIFCLWVLCVGLLLISKGIQKKYMCSEKSLMVPFLI